MRLRWTLAADGTSDRALMPVITHLLGSIPTLQDIDIVAQFAGFVGFDLARRVQEAVRRFPCDILFVHRDAENAGLDARHSEICAATANATPNIVPTIPVRMTEAWLLIDARAIRKAADNPNGTIELEMPDVLTLEGIPNPKALMSDLLIRASEKSGRRRRRFTAEIAWRRARVAMLIEDFSALRHLPAFNCVQAATEMAVTKWLRDSQTV